MYDFNTTVEVHAFRVSSALYNASSSQGVVELKVKFSDYFSFFTAR